MAYMKKGDVTGQELFRGRSQELGLLREHNWRNHAQLIVVYGRRRVGKTALVEHAYGNGVLWKFEGLEGESSQRQIQSFVANLAAYAGKPAIREPVYADWGEVFEVFAAEIKDRKCVVFFDEFQWLAEMQSTLVSLFKYYWDNHFRKCRQARFVLCGSISSFMVRQVLKSRALYGRVDTEINLKPLSMNEMNEFFEGSRSKDEVIQFSMTFGGVPQYLEELNPTLSYMQNLNEYAFRATGYFFQEYARLFISHLADSPLYEKILLHLSLGVSNTEALAKACQTTIGGGLSRKIADLEMCGFIHRETPVDKGVKSRLIRYRLDDEYLHFYFRFILPNVPEILAGRVSMQTLTHGKGFEQWQGQAFERLCHKNAHAIARYLQFSGITYRYGPWFQRGTESRRGVQIDLLFDRADKVLTVCEMKYTKHLASRKIIDDFEKKQEVLLRQYAGYSVQKVLILGKKASPPSALKKYFDHVLLAEEVFF